MHRTQAIEAQGKEFRSRISRQRCQEIADEDSSEELKGLSKGSRFLHKFMSLLRKDGKSTWGVYYYKLRGKSGFEPLFDKVLQVLVDQSVVEFNGNMIILFPQIETYMFDGRRRAGRPMIDDFSKFWTPIVNQIDNILH